MSRQAILALLLMGAVVFPGLAQRPSTSPSTPPQTKQQTQPSPQPSAATDDQDDVVRITTNLVQVDAIVTKDRKPLATLRRLQLLSKNL